MWSQEKFKILGYGYGFFGAIGTICIAHNILAVSPKYPALAMIPVVIWLVMFVVLIVGIKRRSISMVRSYRVYLITTNVFSLFIAMLGMLLLLAIGRLSDNETMIEVFLFTMLCAAGVFALAMWIINGVIRFIKNERERNRQEALRNVEIQCLDRKDCDLEKQNDHAVVAEGKATLASCTDL